MESASFHTQNGLVTWGEFGSVLLLILNDAVHGETTWSHWELTATEPVSVFNYSVPKSASHYQIATPLEEIQGNGGSSRWWAAGGMSSAEPFSKSKVLRSRPAYHGSLWIDPASGTVFRVSLVADLKGNPTLESGAILVEYGPVRINAQTFMCPLRSLALSTAPGGVSATLKGTATEWMNENLFTDYHLFASTSRIVTEQADSSSSEPPAKSVYPDVVDSAGTPASAAVPSALPPEAAPLGNQPPAASGLSPSPPTTEETSSIDLQGAGVRVLPNSPGIEPSSQPASTGAPPGMPSVDTNTAPAPGAPATFRLNVNAVLVPVVVRDGHGNFVDDLQKQDFEVLDDGKPRPISGFLVEKHKLSVTAPNSPAEAPMQPGAVPRQITLPGRIAVFVFDDLNMGFEEISHAQTAATKILDGVLTGSDMAAVVSTSGKVNSGLTRDRAKLVNAIKAVRPVDLYHLDSADCPKIGYYQADLIVNKHDANALQDVIKQIMWVCAPKPPADLARGMAEAAARRACSLGQQSVRDTYAAISEYVRRMAKLPGQHTLILVSSGFLPIEQEARYEESKLMDLAAGSGVAINALDARGLYTTFLTAGEDIQGREPRQVAEYRESEMRAAENAMGELAYATGGDFYHNNNDLEAGFRALLKIPETIYVLELATDGVKVNGAYHRLKISVDRADVQVQARKGYVAPQDEQTRTNR